MRDYYKGEIPIRKLSRGEINKALAGAVAIECIADCTVENVLERMRIELVIRAILGEHH